MPFTRERMGADDFAVPLVPDCPQSILDATNVETYGYSHIVITPAHFSTRDVGGTDLLDIASFVGILLNNTDGGLNLEGEGLHWLLGGENDGGDCYTGADTPAGPLKLEDFIDAVIIPNANGLTKGQVNAAATTRTVNLVDGITMLQLLETACATYANPDYEYMIDTRGRIHVDTKANLYSTTATPAVILTGQGGRDSAILGSNVVTGLHADLTVPDRSVADRRSHVEVNWTGDGTDNGTATNSPPAGVYYVGFDGSDLVYRTSIQKTPRRPFRDRPNKWSDRAAAAHWAAYAVAAKAQASNMAASIANQLATAWYEIQADVDDHDISRFLQPGDGVWCHDLGLGLLDPANEVYYRGTAVHPKKYRVEAMTCPIPEGSGVYVRYWTGAAFEYLDLTDWIAWEDGPTTLELGVRHPERGRPARPHRFNHRQFRNQQRRWYLLDQYFQTVGN